MGGGCNQSPNPNNPAEYCSTIPPLQQAQASGALSSPPPTVMVPVGVLKQPGSEGKFCRILPKAFLICRLLISTFQQCSNCVRALCESPTRELHYRYV
uniref:Smad anchor for receptor activation-like Smad-binding domain-containing protein n=1 Tax=Sinocyclocheilus grahami TaxID=75366 RepID=A0A672LE43_SINGR